MDWLWWMQTFLIFFNVMDVELRHFDFLLCFFSAISLSWVLCLLFMNGGVWEILPWLGFMTCNVVCIVVIIVKFPSGFSLWNWTNFEHQPQRWVEAECCLLRLTSVNLLSEGLSDDIKLPCFHRIAVGCITAKLVSTENVADDGSWLEKGELAIWSYEHLWWCQSLLKKIYALYLNRLGLTDLLQSLELH